MRPSGLPDVSDNLEARLLLLRDGWSSTASAFVRIENRPRALPPGRAAPVALREA